jgi:hypothetical protein
MIAGVSLGPFPDYKSGMGMLMGSAAELWEFANPASEMSRRYEVALKEALEYGVRITFVGSIDDQLVPMEVGPFHPLHILSFTVCVYLAYCMLTPSASPPFTLQHPTLISTGRSSSTAESMPLICESY